MKKGDLNDANRAAHVMRRYRDKRWSMITSKRIRLSMVALFAAASVTAIMSMQTSEFVSGSPSVTWRFESVRSEDQLIDLCYRIQEIYGVTGVTYQNYDATNASATVTVFFNPQATSVRQIRILMMNAKILWNRPMSV
jgi:hypothetical protein